MKLLSAIRIYRYAHEGGTRYLARISEGHVDSSFNEPTLKALVRRLKREVLR